MLDVKTPRPSPLGARFDEVTAATGLSDHRWAQAAGYSRNYVAVLRMRAADDPGYELPEKTARALADAANVDETWLRFGRGSRERRQPTEAPTQPGALAGAAAPAAYQAAELAALEAFRWGICDPEDLVALLAVLRGGEIVLPDEHEHAVVALATMLRAARALRRQGRPVTLAAIVWLLARPELQVEGLDLARELGVTPPDPPRRTPPRGLKAAGRG